MKLQVNLDGFGIITIEATDGRIFVDGREIMGQTMQALGEAVHNVRVVADIQAAAIRRTVRTGDLP